MNNSSQLPNVRFIGLNLYPDVGGPFKSVSLFRAAIGGEVISVSTKIPDKAPEQFKYVPTSQHHFYTRSTRDKAFNYCKTADLISCHSIFRYHNILARNISHKLKIPYWAVPHGSMDPWVFSYGKTYKRIWYKNLGERYFKDARFVILATEKERDKMAERYNGENMRVVYWPVEPLDTSKKAEHRKAFRSKYQIPLDAKVLLYFGRYHSMKRPIETIQLFAKSNLSKDTHLVMVGIDFDVSREQLQATASGKTNVHVLGPLYGDEREQLLLSADAYISLSHRENFNHTAAEAMTAGQAVILSAGNDLQYSFPQESDFGWRLQSNDESEVIEALKTFDSSNLENIQAKGSAAQQWALNELSFSKFQAKLNCLLKESIS